MRNPSFVIVGGNLRSLISNRLKLMLEMCELGYNVKALVPSDDNVPDWFDEKFEVIRFDRKRNSLNPVHFYKSIKQIQKIRRTLKYDIWFSYNAFPIFISNLFLLRKQNVKNVSLITGLGAVFSATGPKFKLLQRVILFLYWLSLKSCEYVIFQNDDDKLLFERLGIAKKSKKIVVPGSGIDLASFNHSNSPTETSFLMMSRPLISKGLIEYFEACNTLKLRYPNVRFVYLGMTISGHPFEITEEQLSYINRYKSVEVNGHVDNVQEYIRSASVFVNPSYYREGIPRACLEALAVGRPIITTNTPGNREVVINDKNGKLISAKSVAELVEAMEFFIQNKELIQKYGMDSHLLAQQKFDVNKVNRLISNFILND